LGETLAAGDGDGSRLGTEGRPGGNTGDIVPIVGSAVGDGCEALGVTRPPPKK
jgi:hypothetical protein